MVMMQTVLVTSMMKNEDGARTGTLLSMGLVLTLIMMMMILMMMMMMLLMMIRMLLVVALMMMMMKIVVHIYPPFHRFGSHTYN